ncbi:MAG: PRC and DUF2382 domain-containing protein [Streptosporangiaceae bacterium]
MTTTQELQNMEGQTAVDVNGKKLGKIGQIYVDDQTSQPLWVTITTGMFGTKQSFAPLHGSRPSGDDLQLAVTKDMVTDAPGIEADGHIEDSENEALYTYYHEYLGGTAQDTSYQDQGYAQETREDMAGRDSVQGRDTSGPTTDEAMTRSEEQLHVGTEQVQAGRARLRKYVVTENVTQTVPVSHEEVRLEREPVTDANRDAAMSGSDISEEEHEVTLRAERPVVEKETVPVERVRLGTETVTEDHEVSETVRKEQIDDLDVETDGTTR